MSEAPLLTLGFILILILSAFAGYAMGVSHAGEQWQKEAISRGHAEYALVGPEIKFRWKEKP